jgi:hypothetical protein
MSKSNIANIANIANTAIVFGTPSFLVTISRKLSQGLFPILDLS